MSYLIYIYEVLIVKSRCYLSMSVMYFYCIRILLEPLIEQLGVRNQDGVEGKMILFLGFPEESR